MDPTALPQSGGTVRQICCDDENRVASGWIRSILCRPVGDVSVGEPSLRRPAILDLPGGERWLVRLFPFVSAPTSVGASR